MFWIWLFLEQIYYSFEGWDNSSVSKTKYTFYMVQIYNDLMKYDLLDIKHPNKI